MGAILGSSIRSTAGSKVFDQVEMLRSKTKAWRDGSGSLSDVQKEVKKFSNSDLLKVRPSEERSDELLTLALGTNARRTLSPTTVIILTHHPNPFRNVLRSSQNARAFAHFLRLANVAESHHRVRMLSQPSSSLSASSILALPSKPDSCGGTISSLLSSGSTTAEEIFEALSTQKTELILTAHPTEVNRKTLLNHTAKIQSLLSQADDVRSGGTKYEQMEVDSGLRSSIASIWQSDEVSRFKPTVQSEAYRGTLVVSTVLWKAVPSFLRKLDAEMRSGLGEDKGLPLKSAPVQFGSWMGGDRDGNPNVTSNVTREVALVNRLEAASLILADLDALHEELSLVSAGDELVGRVGEGTREPYRIYLRGVIDKMQRTIEEVGSDLDDVREGRGGYDHSGGFDALYFDTDDLCEDLSVIHRSLSDTGNGSVARGRLTDLIRNLQCFGLTLVPLDLRQEADRHEDAMDAITRYLGQGSYKGWDEDTKVAWLGKQIAGKRPLIGKGTWRKPRNEKFFTPEVVEVLDTFEMAAEQGPGTLGAYVISQATLASDVMSVLLLQLSSGCLSPLRVAPLFETLDDLKGAENTMRTLWDNPAYMGRCRGKQEIMVGYSDSAKDAGRLAASWAQYETQEKLAKMGRDKGVEVTFFHGKGGTVGRGGNPATFHAILGHPPETIDGRFRVTEQGEMINQNFGHPYIAERTLDIYTAAVLAEGFREEEKVGSEWRSAMDRLSDVSVSEYRGIVRGDERFVPYFRSSTPELELTGLNIGSRPAKRKPGGGVER